MWCNTHTLIWLPFFPVHSLKILLCVRWRFSRARSDRNVWGRVRKICLTIFEIVNLCDQISFTYTLSLSHTLKLSVWDWVLLCFCLNHSCFRLHCAFKTLRIRILLSWIVALLDLFRAATTMAWWTIAWFIVRGTHITVSNHHPAQNYITKCKINERNYIPQNSRSRSGNNGNNAL